MTNWKHLKLKGIVNIEKCVGEFDVYEDISPYGRFKVKVYETSKGDYRGHTKLAVKIKPNQSKKGEGYGSTVMEALNNTIKNCIELLKTKNKITEDDIEEIPDNLF